MVYAQIDEAGNLWINVGPPAARPSSSGKTTIVASTGGFAKAHNPDGSPLLMDGHPVSVSVNATIPVAMAMPAAPAAPVATGTPTAPHGAMLGAGVRAAPMSKPGKAPKIG